MDRKVFLKRIIKSFFVLLGSVVLFSFSSLYPSKIRKKELRYVPLLGEEELPRRGVRRVDFTYETKGRKVQTRAFIVASGERIVAFSPVCSHLGCLVNWDHNKKEFICPCHGGKYDINGIAVAGPPPGPLTRLPVEIRDGRVYIGIRI